MMDYTEENLASLEKLELQKDIWERKDGIWTKGHKKAEFKIMNRFDEWLDIREVKEILIIETENIRTPGGRINIYLVVLSL